MAAMSPAIPSAASVAMQHTAVVAAPSRQKKHMAPFHLITVTDSPSAFVRVWLQHFLNMHRVTRQRLQSIVIAGSDTQSQYMEFLGDSVIFTIGAGPQNLNRKKRS